MMMGTQLYNDAVMPEHHKYAAHQVALLYVSAHRVKDVALCPVWTVQQARLQKPNDVHLLGIVGLIERQLGSWCNSVVA